MNIKKRKNTVRFYSCFLLPNFLLPAAVNVLVQKLHLLFILESGNFCYILPKDPPSNSENCKTFTIPLAL